MKKKVISVLLCMSILIAGCGGKKNEAAESTDAAAAAGAENSFEEPAEAEAESSEEEEPSVSEAEADGTGSETEEASSAGSDIFIGSVEDGGYVITTCTSKEDSIEVPAAIDGVPVVRIGESAFYELTCKKITLPDSVTSIGDYAFFFCESLEEIELGNGLKRVGAQAFANCPSLKSVSFPEGVESIACPFYMNDELGDVYIPASVTEITDGIGSPDTCPKMVVVTPEGSAAEAQAIEEGYPVRNE